MYNSFNFASNFDPDFHAFLTARTFPALLGYGVGLATAMTGFEYTGGLWGHGQKTVGDDEFERRTQLRKNYRTPAEQTLSELGEGRGRLNMPTGQYEKWEKLC